jgi:hypothetical protein
LVAKVDFYGDDLLIVVKPGFTTLDVKTDIYSDWKEWQLIGDNSKYSQAFIAIGGDPIGGGLYAGSYYFLTNGWKIRPDEVDHTLTLLGNIFGEGGAAIITPTLGSYTVAVNVVTSSQAQGIATGGSTAPTSIENADALLDRLNAIETGLTVRQTLRLITAVLGGKVSGAGTGSEVFRATDDSKDRVTVTVDSSGNRSNVTTDLT